MKKEKEGKNNNITINQTKRYIIVYNNNCKSKIGWNLKIPSLQKKLCFLLAAQTQSTPMMRQ